MSGSLWQKGTHKTEEKQQKRWGNNTDLFDETVVERYNIYNILKEDTLWDLHIS